MLIIEVPKMANPKSIDMQAVCLLNGPLCERRRSAQTDRVTKRGTVLQAQLERLDQDLPQIQGGPITEWNMHWKRKH